MPKKKTPKEPIIISLELPPEYQSPKGARAFQRGRFSLIRHGDLGRITRLAVKHGILRDLIALKIVTHSLQQDE